MRQFKSWILFSVCAALLAVAVLGFSLTTQEFEKKYINKNNVSSDELLELNNTIKAIQKYYITDVSTQKLMDNALRGMVSQLDPHSDFLDKRAMDELNTTVSGEFAGIGVELTIERGMLRVISPIADSPAARAGIKPGDLIVKIDDKIIQDMTVSNAINYIKGTPGTEITLTIIRKDEQKPLKLTMKREIVKIQSVKSKMLAPGYGYIRLAIFQGPVENKMKEAITKLKQESNGELKGFILDLRNNPGGLLDVSADVVDLFLDKNEKTNQYHHLIVYTKGRMPSSNIRFYAKPGDIIPNVPMVVLINGGSASASEIAAGALQDYKRVIVMGTRSFGKGSVQTVIPITKNSALKLTTALYYTPAGREIQARGIEPDVIIPDLTVDPKKITGLIDFDEANYDRHILNSDPNKIEQKPRDVDAQSQEKSISQLAVDDYQLYEALMMLKGLHAIER
ncbi:MAG: peptidase S41 [Gammaproteobacteria bacterium RIFCSPLOWO2_02_FULL_42_14]|nr:MAG: peptidase S41 [Gammaproteobacteria bacterium RIFCSPHIGHO2_02_FULL_42_43]OGT29526.1 MAG: peptidase S41 [Gammaproteobacteria bacterium RIFCSPHIGHO2_01_FULL_42_8]OGT52412.1 MAG: peptidase S41 [Gammaproteobacteria bacterium RIFCSPHIGHO2_12_FULL_41_25]OGT62460.1 MAG: peptidase S41 [Gammaproteobacteria bacterium RIFCSPLOWO2_02_FULL_42_14]OGT86264.1 MAG: peptidase S41 [Gammaproteobacteria bacterium RIFCSPLOWO2_12_FULL_42_18]